MKFRAAKGIICAIVTSSRCANIPVEIENGFAYVLNVNKSKSRTAFIDGILCGDFWRTKNDEMKMKERKQMRRACQQPYRDECVDRQMHQQKIHCTVLLIH